MSNAPAPYTGGQAPATDGDNRYKSVQHKLMTLARTLDNAALELEQLQLRMKTNGRRSEEAAAAIANAGLDPLFVEMQNAVSLALGGAEMSARKVNESAHEVSSLAHDAQATHARLYQGLDDIRSSRRYQTPRPGFFTR